MTGLPEEMSPTVLRVGDPFRRFSLLKPGTRRYVVTREMEGAVSALGVITKTISFEPHAGRPAVHIVQTTEGGSRVVWDSWFEPETFRPLTHDRTTRRGDEIKVEAFEFYADRVAGRRDVVDNASAAFERLTDEPVFNFEADMETLQLLPWTEGYSVSIPFYHPGSPRLSRHIFRVNRRGSLSLPGGGSLDCWEVTTDYGRPAEEATRFHVACEGQEVVKVVTPAPGGRVVKSWLL